MSMSRWCRVRIVCRILSFALHAGCEAPPASDVAALPSPATAPLICTTRTYMRPTWHFSVQVKMPQALIDKYGLGPQVYAADQLSTINARFNAAATFSGDVRRLRLAAADRRGQRVLRQRVRAVRPHHPGGAGMRNWAVIRG